MAILLPAAGQEAPPAPPMPLRFDRRLVKRYDRPGPRYTSYPTAPQFRDDFGPAETAALMAASRRRPRPLSLYVHVPFCETRCLFCGCNVVVTRRHERAAPYLDLIEREMHLAAELLGAADRRTVEIHWGGGTPTFLTPEEIARLAEVQERLFPATADRELSVELDPRRCTPDHLDALAAAGATRLSLGIQDLDLRVQLAVRRLQPAQMAWDVLSGARRRGINSVNIDLIYGLPHQTPERFRRTVDEVLQMAPDRIALFSFAYLPDRFRHQRAIPAAALPSPQVKLTLLEESIELITDAGYVFIGMDHFAKPEDPLARALAAGTLRRNFQGYATGGENDLAAFGVSAISSLAGGYAQSHHALPAYREAILAGRLATCRGLVPSPEDRLRQRVIMDLMCRFAIDRDEVEAAFGIDFDHHFAAELEALEPLADDGLVRFDHRRIEVTPIGHLLVRNVAMIFDAYLPPASQDTAVAYSRTV